MSALSCVRERVCVCVGNPAVCVCHGVCVCVCVRERERERVCVCVWVREIARKCMHAYMHTRELSVRACTRASVPPALSLAVCVRERD